MATPDTIPATILVAEDNALNRKIILLQLSLLGYRAEAAEDGVQALALWRQGPYSLLLSDLHMPNMDGYALTEAIRREEAPGQRMAIVAYSANVLQQDQERCRALGMDDFLPKPVQLPALKVALEKWLGAAPDIAIGQKDI